MELTIETMQLLCVDKNIEMTRHVLDRCIKRGIKYSDIKNCLMSGEIIEHYPDDYPYPSCLILGVTIGSEKLHVVVGLSEDRIWIVTAYYPDPERWALDFRKRKET